MPQRKVHEDIQKLLNAAVEASGGYGYASDILMLRVAAVLKAIAEHLPEEDDQDVVRCDKLIGLAEKIEKSLLSDK